MRNRCQCFQRLLGPTTRLLPAPRAPQHHRPAAPCWWRIQRTCVYTCRDGARCLALDAAAAAAAGEHGLYHRQLHQLNDHLSRGTVCKTRLLTHIAMLNEVSWHYGSMNELLSSLRWSLPFLLSTTIKIWFAARIRHNVIATSKCLIMAAQ